MFGAGFVDPVRAWRVGITGNPLLKLLPWNFYLSVMYGLDFLIFRHSHFALIEALQEVKSF